MEFFRKKDSIKPKHSEDYNDNNTMIFHELPDDSRFSNDSFMDLNVTNITQTNLNRASNLENMLLRLPQVSNRQIDDNNLLKPFHHNKSIKSVSFQNSEVLVHNHTPKKKSTDAAFLQVPRNFGNTGVLTEKAPVDPKRISIMRRSFNTLQSITKYVKGSSQQSPSSSEQNSLNFNDGNSNTNGNKNKKKLKFQGSSEPDQTLNESEELDNLKMQLPESVVNLLMQPRRNIDLKDDHNFEDQKWTGMINNNENHDASYDDNILQQALAIQDNDLQNFEEKKIDVKTKEKMPFLIFSYKSKSRMYWDLLIILLALYNCIMIPIEVSYSGNFFSSEENLRIGYFEYAIDGLFALDIFFSFRTTYLDVSSGKEITDQKIIAKKYFKSGGLAFDLMSTIPIDEVIAQMIPQDTAKHLGLLGLIKMTRMLRLRKIINFMNVQQSLKNSIRMFQLILLLLLAVHWVACIWYLLVIQGVEDNEVWKPVFDDDIDSSDFYKTSTLYQYLVTFYYSVLILIGRANEMGPVTLSQTTYCAFILILGSFVSTFIFGNIAATMESATKKDSKLSQRLSLIQSNMVLIKLPVPLQDEIIKYVMQVEQAPEVQYDLNMFLETLSPSLKSKVLHYLHNRIIRNLSEFKDAHEVEINYIANHFKTLLVLPTNKIIQQGTYGQEMYFIINGKVSIILTMDISKSAKQSQNDQQEQQNYSPLIIKKRKLVKRNKFFNSQGSSLQQKLSSDGSQYINQQMQTSQDQVSPQPPLSASIYFDRQSEKSLQEQSASPIYNNKQDIDDLKGGLVEKEDFTLTTLEFGGYFGEIALLSKLKRTTTVQAIDYSTLSSLSRETMDIIKVEYPQIYMNFKRKLDNYTDDEMQMRRRFIANIPFFNKISDELITELIYLLRETAYDGGNVVVKHGDLSDRIHIVWKGFLRVEIYYNGKDHFFEKLNRGSCFCVFSAFSDDYTQVFDFKVLSEQATILTLKAKDMIKLAKRNLELADIIKTLEISIKQHQKSDFDFFRFLNVHPVFKPEEYRRQLRLKFQRVLRQIAQRLLNKEIKMTEPLLVVQQICKERKLREQRLRMMMLKKDEQLQFNTMSNRERRPSTLQQQNNLLISQSSRELLSSRNGTTSVDSSVLLSSRLMKHVKNINEIEEEQERITKTTLKEEEFEYEDIAKKNRKQMISQILNPYDVPGVELKIFDRIDGLPKDQNMYTKEQIEVYENLQARIEKQKQTRENVQFLNKLIFQQNSQISQLKHIFNKQTKELEQRIFSLAQQSRIRQKQKLDLRQIEEQEKLVNMDEFVRCQQKQDIFKQKCWQSFGQQQNVDINRIDEQINSFITVNPDGTFLTKTIEFSSAFQPLQIDGSKEDILTKTDVSHNKLPISEIPSYQNIQFDQSTNTLETEESQEEQLQLPIEQQRFKEKDKSVRNKSRPKSQFLRRVKPQMLGKKLQNEINVFGDQSPKAQQKITTIQRRLSKLDELKPQINELRQQRTLEEEKKQIFKNEEEPAIKFYEDFDSTIKRAESIAVNSQISIMTPNTQKKIKRSQKKQLKQRKFTERQINLDDKITEITSQSHQANIRPYSREQSQNLSENPINQQQFGNQSHEVNFSSLPQIQDYQDNDDMIGAGLNMQSRFIKKRAKSKYGKGKDGTLTNIDQSKIQILQIPERSQTRDQSRMRPRSQIRKGSSQMKNSEIDSNSTFNSHLQSNLTMLAPGLSFGINNKNKNLVVESSKNNISISTKDNQPSLNFGFYKRQSQDNQSSIEQDQLQSLNKQKKAKSKNKKNKLKNLKILRKNEEIEENVYNDESLQENKSRSQSQNVKKIKKFKLDQNDKNQWEFYKNVPISKQDKQQ